MKNVAATSGHSVSLALRFAGEIARVGNWAGRDIVLNLLSRPPLSDPRTLTGAHSARVRFRRIRIFAADARVICIQTKDFSVREFLPDIFFGRECQADLRSGNSSTGNLSPSKLAPGGGKMVLGNESWAIERENY
jgi:hypothetical protein